MALDHGTDADDYFNDLSRQPHSDHSPQESPSEPSQNATSKESSAASKPKRIACVVCRKRKLKCDGCKPSCATCARLGHHCAYDEVRRKSGPKRGYVKELEARLAQVETQLKTKVQKKPPSNPPGVMHDGPGEPALSTFPLPALDESSSISLGLDFQGPTETRFDLPTETINQYSSSSGGMPDANLENEQAFSWEMIGLGLEEPLPTQEAINELHRIYFDYIHPNAPMLHKYRYRAAMDLAPHMRPPVCLRYAMWAMAASISDKFFNHHEIFYRRARKYAELDEMKGQGESFVSVGHAQCWILISSYEFKMMYFPRAWMSAGKASRLCLMLGFNRLDGTGLDVKQCIAPPRDWTDREERRRTFWQTFCVDRYASIGTGWPMTLDEKDILTNVPASDEAYDRSIPQQTMTLQEALRSKQPSNLSSMAGVIFMAYFFGQNLIHLHRPEPNEQEDDLQGEFWKRHRRMDNTILNISLSLPPHLRLTSGVREPKVVFLNMGIHTAAISLHQAAIFKAEGNGLPSNVVEQSQLRCLIAAGEIATTMRLVSHLDPAAMNPFMAFCLYVAARVFVQCLKKIPNQQEWRASLEFLLNAMNALKRRNPLSESFLMQLTLDIEGTGLDDLIQNAEFSSSMMKGVGTVPADFDSVHCSPLIDIRKTQGVDASKNPAIFAPKNPAIFAPVRGKSMPGIFPKSPVSATPTHGNPGSVKYPIQNLSLPVREQRSSPQMWNRSPEELISLDGILTGSGWVETSPIAHQGSPSDTATYDTNMSDSTSEGPKSGMTPSTNHSSSNTSYSSPHEENIDNIGPAPSHHRSQDSIGLTPAGGSTPGLFPFGTTEEVQYPIRASPRMQNNGGLGDGQVWSVGSPNAMPGGLASSPSSDAAWAQLLDGVLWDNSQAGVGNTVQWTGQ